MQRRKWHPLTLISATLAMLTLSLSAARAADVIQAKDGRVLIRFTPGSETIKEGEKYFVMVDEKKRAIVEIKQVKGDKAIGQVVKSSSGAALTGGKLKFAQTGGASASKTANNSHGRRARSRSGAMSSRPSADMSWGVLGAYGLDSQTIKSISLSGSGYELKGFFATPLIDNLDLVGRVGYEKFLVTGKSNLGNEKVDIQFLSADGLFQYNFTESSVVPYVMAGMAFKYPLSQSSGGLLVEKSTIQAVALAGGGVNWNFSQNWYACFQAEYSYFLMQTDVTTSVIAIRAGLGLPF
jgi:hypothetical protein